MIDGKWRLPTIQELLSVVDYTKCNPSTNIEGIKSEYYWSSSPITSDSPSVWIVNFYYGYSYDGNKSDSSYVRVCKTLQDGSLEWAKEDAPAEMTWYEAIEYAESLWDIEEDIGSYKVLPDEVAKQLQEFILKNNENPIPTPSKPKNVSICCTKCGSEDIKTKYVDKGVEFLFWLLPNSHKGFIDSNNITTKEILLRSCSDCDYSWCEDVINTKDNND